MRKPLIVIMSILFTGALLVYTAQANLNLLQQVYVNPQYVAFGMLALEGGVIYWLGYYLLHWDNNHKAIALVMSGLDFLLSMIGFFMDLNLHTGDEVHTALPPVLIVMSIDVALNVGVGLLVHFLPHGAEQQKPTYQPPNPQPKNVQDTGETDRPLEQMAFAQTATANQPTTGFWNRMKAATEAFRASGQRPQPAQEVTQSQSQAGQQEAEAQMQGQE